MGFFVITINTPYICSVNNYIMKSITNTISNNKEIITISVIVITFIGVVIHNFLKYGANF